MTSESTTSPAGAQPGTAKPAAAKPAQKAKPPAPDTRTRPAAELADPEMEAPRNRASHIGIAAMGWLAVGAVVTALLAMLVRYLN